MTKIRKETSLEVLRKGLVWWLTRVAPFLVIYILVKALFFAGYFEVFGEKEVQIMAHDFFVKFLVTICVIITFIAFKRYFLKFNKISLKSSGKKLFKRHEMGYEFVIILTKG
ncbi:MAG: hypothetical protein GF368_01475, partial [Candidatus Aenigmarchaeota archaeon]|nr:hypothetical protein [Candidatus Aenigmarchaeota archaeon]